MSENDEKEGKGEQSKVIKKRRSDNKRLEDVKEKEADDISKMFPNFSVLTEEEQLVFFETLTTARKNIEKTGVPIRKCFGTVHDEYLKYFDQNDCHKEKKSEENRSIQSSSGLCNNGLNSGFDESDEKDDQRQSKESMFSSQSIKKTPQESYSSIRSESNSRKQHGLVIQMETDKIIQLFLKKKKKFQEKADSIRPNEKILENEDAERFMKENRCADQKPLKKSDTPKFDVLSPEEKAIFFRILQQAYENILKKNLNKDYHILPLDAILRKYHYDNEATTHCVFAATQDALKCGETKKDLKLTVRVSLRDDKELCPQIKANEKKQTENCYYTLESLTHKPDEEDEECLLSKEAIEMPGNESDSVTSRNIFEMEITSNKSRQSSFQSPKTSRTNVPIKISECKIVNEEENHLKNGEKIKISRCQENGQNVIELRANSAEKYLNPQEESSISFKEKNYKKGEHQEFWPEEIKTQVDFSAETLKKVCEELKPKEKVKLKLSEDERIPVTLVEELKNNEKKTLIASQQEKKLSFFCENSKEESSKVLKKDCDSRRREKPEEILKERNSVKTIPGSEEKVMIVSEDVVGKIKSLIWCLDAKANANTHLEKEYLKLIVDYTDYLSKILETLILKKKRKKKEALEFPRCCDYSKKKNQIKSDLAKSEFLLCPLNQPMIKMKRQSASQTEETTQKSPKEMKTEFHSNFPVRSDSEIIGSEEESCFNNRNDSRDGILLQDFLRRRSKFVKGSFDNVRVIQFSGKKVIPGNKLFTVENRKDKRKIFKYFLRIFNCGVRKKITKKKKLGKSEGDTVGAEPSGGSRWTSELPLGHKGPGGPQSETLT